MYACMICMHACACMRCSTTCSHILATVMRRSASSQDSENKDQTAAAGTHSHARSKPHRPCEADETCRSCSRLCSVRTTKGIPCRGFLPCTMSWSRLRSLDIFLATYPKENEQPSQSSMANQPSFARRCSVPLSSVASSPRHTVVSKHPTAFLSCPWGTVARLFGWPGRERDGGPARRRPCRSHCIT